MKTAQTILIDKKLLGTTTLGVETMNSNDR